MTAFEATLLLRRLRMLILKLSGLNCGLIRVPTDELRRGGVLARWLAPWRLHHLRLPRREPCRQASLEMHLLMDTGNSSLMTMTYTNGEQPHAMYMAATPTPRHTWITPHCSELRWKIQKPDLPEQAGTYLVCLSHPANVEAELKALTFYNF